MFFLTFTNEISQLRSSTCQKTHFPQKIYKLRQTKLSQFEYFSLVLREREEKTTTNISHLARLFHGSRQLMLAPQKVHQNSVPKQIYLQCTHHNLKDTIFPHLVSAIEQFPPLNSFRSKNLVSQVKKIEICSNYLSFLQFPNSKKNSCRGNYLWKYSS